MRARLICFDVFLCFLINLTLNSGGCLDVVVALQKFVQLAQTLSEIFDWHWSILIKVETKPVVLHKHCNVAVRLCNILYEWSLSFAKNFDEHPDEVGCLVNVDYYTLVKFTNCLCYCGFDLQTTFLHLLVLCYVVNVWVCQLVSFRFLQVVQSTRSLEKP
jgi:hypothetical protein